MCFKKPLCFLFYVVLLCWTQATPAKEIFNLSEVIFWLITVVCKYAFIMMRGGKTSLSKSQKQKSNVFNAGNNWIYMIGYYLFSHLHAQVKIRIEQCITAPAKPFLVRFLPTLLHNLHKSTFNKPPKPMSSSSLTALSDYATCDWDRNLGTQSRVPTKQRDIINTAGTLGRYWLSVRVKPGQEDEPASQTVDRKRGVNTRGCVCVCVCVSQKEKNDKTGSCDWNMRNEIVVWWKHKTEGMR